jgi:D-alanyl-lipoteichoic acid acyltransferase DltB (MBOAT superfamily)
LLFNSTAFLVFFPAVTVLYFALPGRWRAAMLLLASCYFYMAFIPAYLWILAGTIVVDYAAGIGLERLQGSPRRRLFLIASLIANIGVLAVFKYYNFFAASVGDLAAALGVNGTLPILRFALPIGLSFHTFQAMSYTLEVYKGRQPAERNFLLFALYVMFYPQLVAGPIERPQNILPQLHTTHAFDARKLTEGLELMLWGFFKKIVIADRLSLAVDHVYSAPGTHQGQELVFATYAFAIQIYCDFSGYSSIARGAARVMGIDLMENFDTPYLATSIADFWSRWHISLSTWFRDYLYIPLGGNRVGAPRRYRNLLVVFIVSGLWHGANWTYLVWGALHGFYAVVGTRLAERNPAHLPENVAKNQAAAPASRLWRWTRRLITFQLVAFAWIFFRAASLSDAWQIVSHLTDLHARLDVGLSRQDVALSVMLVLGLFALEAGGANPFERLRGKVFVRWSFSYALVFSLMLLGKYTSREFIYFQF